MDLTNCPNCDHELRLSCGPGRLWSYRGESGFEIPANFCFPECPNCGAEWIANDQVAELSRELERQRDERRRGPFYLAECLLESARELATHANAHSGDAIITELHRRTHGMTVRFVSVHGTGGALYGLRQAVVQARPVAQVAVTAKTSTTTTTAPAPLQVTAL